MNKMKTNWILFLVALSLGLQAQNTRKKVQEGNQAYAEGAFDQAEINYREALKKEDKHQQTLNFNLGDALYKQERFEEAEKAFQESLAKAESKGERAAAYHNLANSYLKQNKLKEAIEHYKKALINDPADEETRYNLAKALEQQKQEQQQQKDQDKDKDDQDKDQQNQDQKDQEDQKDQQDQNDQQQDQKDQDQKDQEKQDPSQSESQKRDINRQNAERLLEALDRDEEKLQKELLKKKIKAKPSNSSKDW